MSRIEATAAHHGPDAHATMQPLYIATVAMSAHEAWHTQPTGRVVSDDGALALVLRAPTHPGGEGSGTNAEQLLAAGLAAGFHGALTTVARSRGMHLAGNFGIVASVHLAPDPFEEGLCLAAELEVALPPMAGEDAESLMLEAQRICPYVKLARSGIRSSFTLRYPNTTPSA